MDLGPHSSPCLQGISPSNCIAGEKGLSSLSPWSPCFFFCSLRQGHLLVPCGSRLSPEPPECQVQGTPWSCAHIGTAGSLGSTSCLPQVWALPLRCTSQGLRKMGSAWCARPRGGSRSPRCSGETSVERSSWRSLRPTPRMLKGCSEWRQLWW